MQLHMAPTVRRSLLVCCAVVVIGTGGYSWIEGWAIWDSLFFTLVTLTTVGYGDYGLSETGERFTAVLMIGGIGSVSYAVSQFIQYATSRAIHPEIQMQQKIEKLQGHHIVCGLGRTGLRVISRLREEGLEVVAIDQNESLVDRARNDGVIALCGDATMDRLLLLAGIDRADSVAAATSSDSANAMICLTARALIPEIKIAARAEGEESVRKLRRAGADAVVSPARYGGDGIAESMIHPEVANLVFGVNEDCGESLRFGEISVPESNCGRTVGEVYMSNPRIVIVAIRSADGDLMMRPGPERILNSGDVLVIAGASMEVGRMSSNRIAA